MKKFLGLVSVLFFVACGDENPANKLVDDDSFLSSDSVQSSSIEKITSSSSKTQKSSSSDKSQSSSSKDELSSSSVEKRALSSSNISSSNSETSSSALLASSSSVSESSSSEGVAVNRLRTPISTVPTCGASQQTGAGQYVEQVVALVDDRRADNHTFAYCSRSEGDRGVLDGVARIGNRYIAGKGTGRNRNVGRAYRKVRVR